MLEISKAIATRFTRTSSRRYLSLKLCFLSASCRLVSRSVIV